MSLLLVRVTIDGVVLSLPMCSLLYPCRSPQPWGRRGCLLDLRPQCCGPKWSPYLQLPHAGTLLLIPRMATGLPPDSLEPPVSGFQIMWDPVWMVGGLALKFFLNPGFEPELAQCELETYDVWLLMGGSSCWCEWPQPVRLSCLLLSLLSKLKALPHVQMCRLSHRSAASHPRKKIESLFDFSLYLVSFWKLEYWILKLDDLSCSFAILNIISLNICSFK